MLVLSRIGIITVRLFIIPAINDIFHKHDHFLGFLGFALIHLTVLGVGVTLRKCC